MRPRTDLDLAGEVVELVEAIQMHVELLAATQDVPGLQFLGDAGLWRPADPLRCAEIKFACGRWSATPPGGSRSR